MAVAVFTASLAMPLDPGPYLTVDESAVLHDRDRRVLHAYLNRDDHWLFHRPLDDMSPYLINATIATEDERFYRHLGVDPFAILRATWQNLRGGEVVSGASTVTMQLVKQRDRNPRTLLGKLMQMHAALRLEFHAPKRELLEAYLNTAPYGMNLLGAEAASKRYFDKPARELTLSEAALLAGLPKAPGALMPIDHRHAAKQRRDFVLQRMRAEGFITANEMRNAQAVPIRAAWHEFPAHAPHLAARLENGHSHRTTLNADIQRMAATGLEAHVRSSGGEITNGAALIIDTATAEVLAHVGSANFFDTPGGGQVDATRARRSPGSTIKPFTFALAMEQQKLYATEIIYDGPADFGRYDPDNFDGTFAGLVTAEEALQASLNVPAVTILERIGPNTLVAFLKKTHAVDSNLDADEYGLGLTLGACETTLESLAELYRALIDGGLYRPLRFTMKDGDNGHLEVIDPTVAAKICEMLTQPLPHEKDPNLISTNSQSPVCWKTGTSTGLRDAWAVVFNRHYVVAVWLGNNDNSPSPYLVGASSALPLAATLFRALPGKRGPTMPSMRAATQDAIVCARSGLPASEACVTTRQAALPRAQFLHRRCDIHRRNVADGVVERWPQSPLRWDLADINVQRNEGVSTPLRITSPPDGAEFVLTGAPRGDAIPLRATHPGDSLHWYLNGRYLATASGEPTPSLALEPGHHTLACLSATGASDTIAFTVSKAEGGMRFAP